MIFIGHCIQKKQNTLSSQVLVEHSPGSLIPWVTKQALVNLRKLKSYQAPFPTKYCKIRNQLQEKNCKKHKHVEAKQYATKQLMDH